MARANTSEGLDAGAQVGMTTSGTFSPTLKQGIALALWGITGVTQKLSTNKISSVHSFVWFSVAFVLVA